MLGVFLLFFVSPVHVRVVPVIARVALPFFETLDF